MHRYAEAYAKKIRVEWTANEFYLFQSAEPDDMGKRYTQLTSYPLKDFRQEKASTVRSLSSVRPFFSASWPITPEYIAAHSPPDSTAGILRNHQSL